MPNSNRILSTTYKVRLDILVCLFLIIATFIVYVQIVNHDFVNYDDDWLVKENVHVQEGITFEGIAWAFQTGSGYWKPLTFLSLMLDRELYGMKAGGFLFTNLLLHILNSVLLFIVFRRMTGSLWQSSFVAVFFALHPLHVESVAWISERKDVLSTFFWMLTMWFYARYADRPDFKRYLPVVIFFVMGLMAKPMLVTLPFALLLLDYWPLGRFQAHNTSQDAGLGFSFGLMLKKGARLIWEKAPLFILAAVSVYITLPNFHGKQALLSRDTVVLSVGYKVSNALISYVSYIGKMIWPAHLAIPYPFYNISTYEVAGAFVLLAIITFFALKTAKSRPYLPVGWFWYLGTLVPVIGIRYFGPFAMADRFTYVPLIGLFVIVAWGFPDLLKSFRFKRLLLASITIPLVLVITQRTWVQAGYWKNSITLFEHSIKVTDNNIFAHNNLGFELERQGKISEAIQHYREAIKILPDYDKAHNNLGNALSKLGHLDTAVTHYSEALRLNPYYAEAYNNLGNVFLKQEQIDQALKQYQKALEIKPEYALAHFNMGIALVKMGDLDNAINHYSEALRLKPDYTEAHRNLEIVRDLKNRLHDSVESMQIAINRDPLNATLYYEFGNLLQKKGDLDEAVENFNKALSLRPEYIPAIRSLAYLYAGKKDLNTSMGFFKRMVELEPERNEIYYNIACLYAQKNEIELAMDWLTRAVEKGYDNWEYIETDNDLENVRSSSRYHELIKYGSPKF